jgi:hypothetical protein
VDKLLCRKRRSTRFILSCAGLEVLLAVERVLEGQLVAALGWLISTWGCCTLSGGRLDMRDWKQIGVRNWSGEGLVE